MDRWLPNLSESSGLNWHRFTDCSSLVGEPDKLSKALFPWSIASDDRHSFAFLDNQSVLISYSSVKVSFPNISADSAHERTGVLVMAVVC